MRSRFSKHKIDICAWQKVRRCQIIKTPISSCHVSRKFAEPRARQISTLVREYTRCSLVKETTAKQPIQAPPGHSVCSPVFATGHAWVCKGEIEKSPVRSCLLLMQRLQSDSDVSAMSVPPSDDNLFPLWFRGETSIHPT